MSLIVRIVGPSGFERYLYLCDDLRSGRAVERQHATLYPTPDAAWSAAVEYAKTHDNIAVSVFDPDAPERQQ